MSIIQSSYLYQLLRFSYRKLSNRKQLNIQVPYRCRKFRIRRLGSAYGGWHFVETDSIYDSIFISGGLEEDVSFEIELIDQFNAKGYLYDPTPSSKKHMEIISKNLGMRRITSYSGTGIQSVTSYQLTRVNENHIFYFPIALSNTCETLKFFAPENNAHQSYSAVYDNTRNEHIEVNAITINQVLLHNHLDKKNVELIKLDIEGSELNVIESILKHKIFPRQLLVEFDDLNRLELLNESGIRRILRIYRNILKNYHLVYSDGVSNFSFIRK